MTKVPRLKADWWAGEGDVIFPPEWDAIDSLMRMDLLQDWIVTLEAAYALAKDDLPFDLGMKPK